MLLTSVINMSLEQRRRIMRNPLNLPLLLKEMNRVPYLASYINSIAPILGLPDFYVSDLPSELKKNPNVNIVYPLGEGIYVHIYTPPGGSESGYRKYITIAVSYTHLTLPTN